MKNMGSNTFKIVFISVFLKIITLTLSVTEHQNFVYSSTENQEVKTEFTCENHYTAPTFFNLLSTATKEGITI
jgi:hypothetical protein